MASNAFAGVGTVFNRDSVAVAEIMSISGPNLTRGTIDVTTLDSTGGYREFIGSFRDGGEVSLTMNMTRDSYDDFLVDLESDDNQAYEIVLPDTGATTFGFSGLVTALGMSIPFDDKVQSDVTIKIDGAITLAS